MSVCDSLQKIHLELTTECNLDCRMCIRHTWQEQDARMTRATFHNLLGQLPAMPSVAIVQFGGFGEPMVHPDVFEFLAQAKEAGLETELITNGLFLSRENVEKLADTGLDRITVSLDGAGPQQDPSLHDSPTALVHAGLRELYRVRVLRRTSRPEVTVEFVATRRNVHELPQLKRLAPMLGFSRILVTNLVPYTAEMADQVLYRKWTTARSNQAPSPWSPVIDLPRMDLAGEASVPVEQLYRSGTHLQLNGVALAGSGMHCRFVHEGRLAIAPDGSVSPCLALLHTHSHYFHGERREIDAYRLGNLDATPLVEIWNAAEYQAFRQRVRAFDFSPCIDCGGCDLRQSNREDCYGGPPPRCGACLWAAGLVQCP